MSSDHVVIFDTTLRDGEQSPGATMTHDEKLGVNPFKFGLIGGTDQHTSLVTTRAESYFGVGVETEERLNSALAGMREECARLIGVGKKVVVR